MDEIRKIRGRLWAPIWKDKLATGGGAKGRTAVCELTCQRYRLVQYYCAFRWES